MMWLKTTTQSMTMMRSLDLAAVDANGNAADDDEVKAKMIKLSF